MSARNAKKPQPQEKSKGGGTSRRTIVAVVLGILFVGLFVVIAVGHEGLGKGSVPKGDVAKVGDRGISLAVFNAALAQAAARQGIKRVPTPKDQQYGLLKSEAMNDVLDVAWIEGEAKDQGISISSVQITQQLKQIKKQNFKNEADFQKFLKQSHFTQADVDQRVKLQLLSQRIQQKIASGIPKVTSDKLQEAYDAAKPQLTQPETRDVRRVLNKSQAKAEEAKKLLEKDGSDANWTKVAKQFSTEVDTKNKGGLRQGLTPGLDAQGLTQQEFKVAKGAIVGPLKTELGYYVFQVVKITPSKTAPLKQVAQQLKQQLAQQEQQLAFERFVQSYRDKWTAMTICAKAYVINRCSNYTPPATQVQSKGAPPVIGTKPAERGTIRLFGTPPGLPQGPHPPGAPKPNAVPGGLPGGVPGLPPGAPGGAPPGAAPGAPPGAPPGAAPGAPPGG